MANPVLDVGIYSPTEQQTLLGLIKTELQLRMTTGRVSQGSSAAQSYGLNVMETADLIRWANSLGAALNLDSVETRVQPNFNPGPSPVLPQETVTQ